MDIRTETIVLPQPEICSVESDNFIERNVFGSIDIKLTRREREILGLLLHGKTNKEIARELCRVERTVEFHRNRLMHKLGAHNSTELVKKAISLGYSAV